MYSTIYCHYCLGLTIICYRQTHTHAMDTVVCSETILMTKLVYIKCLAYRSEVSACTVCVYTFEDRKIVSICAL